MRALLHVQEGRWRRLVALMALLALFSTACSIKLVADYDQPTVDGLIASYESMDRLFERLNSAEPSERAYSKFEDGWSETSTGLRSLALRQSLRAQNDETEQAIQNLIDMWEKARGQHKERTVTAPASPYPQSLLLLDRKQIGDAFFAVLKSEEFKK